MSTGRTHFGKEYRLSDGGKNLVSFNDVDDNEGGGGKQGGGGAEGGGGGGEKEGTEGKGGAVAQDGGMDGGMDGESVHCAGESKEAGVGNGGNREVSHTRSVSYHDRCVSLWPHGVGHAIPREPGSAERCEQVVVWIERVLRLAPKQ